MIKVVQSSIEVAIFQKMPPVKRSIGFVSKAYSTATPEVNILEHFRERRLLREALDLCSKPEAPQHQSTSEQHCLLETYSKAEALQFLVALHCHKARHKNAQKPKHRTTKPGTMKFETCQT